MKNKVIKEILDWVICIIIAYVLYLIINYFFGTVSGVKQSSMYPTAKNGDKLIISRRVINPKEIKRGQIVTLEAPIFEVGLEIKDNIALYPEYDGFTEFAYHVMGIGKKSYVKRVIALEGEHLFISEDGKGFFWAFPRRLTVASSETGGKPLFVLHWSRGCHVSTLNPNIGNKDGLIDMDYSGSHLQMRDWINIF